MSARDKQAERHHLLPRYVHVLPPEYVHAIGNVVVSWSFFEVDLDNAIHFLRQHPEARGLADRLPDNVKQRLRLFRETAKVAFNDYPSALPRLISIGQRASNLASKRHELTHARWTESNDGVGYHGYVVRFGNWGTARMFIRGERDILMVAQKIQELHFDLSNLLGAGFPMNSDELLAQEEIAAVLKFRADHSAKLPAPIPLGWQNLP